MVQVALTSSTASAVTSTQVVRIARTIATALYDASGISVKPFLSAQKGAPEGWPGLRLSTLGRASGGVAGRLRGLAA